MAQTTYADLVTYSAYIDSGIMEVLRTTNVMLGLTYNVNFAPGSDSKKLRSRNAQTAAVVAEGVEATAAVFGNTAGNTLQAKKVVVLNEITEEAQLFGGVELDEVRQEQGLTISEKIDIDICALFTGFSGSASATGVDLTVDKLAEAEYKADLSNVPGPLIFVLAGVQSFDLKKDIITSGAPVWGNPTVSNLLEANANRTNGWKGQILGRDVYVSNHVPTASSDRVGACLNPFYALAVGTVRPVDTKLQEDISKRTIEVSSDYYFDAKERLDAAGCRIISSST